MYRLLIADDEVIERQALKFIVNNSDLALSEIEEAVNGQEVISIAATFNPDIVLLDIKMPGINGIETARILKKINPEIKIIFITAFDEFEYAQEAIKVGVKEFIVKPAPNDRTLTVIENCMKEIELERMQKLQQVDLEMKLSQISKYLESEFINSVVNGEIGEQEASDYLQFMLSAFEEGFGVVIELDFYETNLTKHVHKNMMKIRFIEKLSSLMGRYMKFLMHHNKNTIYILVYGYEIDQRLLYVKTIEDEILQVREALGEQLEANVAYGIGDAYNEISKLWKSFTQAKLISGNWLVDLIDVREEKHAYMDRLEILSNRLCDHLYEGEMQQAQSILEDIIDTVVFNEREEHRRRLKLYEFLVMLNRSLSKDYHSESKGSDILFEALKDMDVKEDVKAYIGQYLIRIMNDAQELKEDKSNNLLEKGVQYINDHYVDEIALETVAELTGFSTHYFCKLFKKTYHCSFTDYITHLRIEQAKIYLKDSELNMKDISYKIGYSDPNYFTRVFKKVEHITPTEYRNQMLTT